MTMTNVTPKILNRKAEILRKAASRIEENFRNYYWADSHSCNCGFVAQVVNNLSQDELCKVLRQEEKQGRHRGVWGKSLEVCEATGLAISTIVQSLYDAGFSGDEIEEFERLSDESIREELMLRLVYYVSYSDRESVIEYFRVKAEHYEAEAQQLQAQAVQSQVGRSVVPASSKKTIETVPVRVQG